jgi:hypothetical protein
MKHPPRNIAIDWLNTIWTTSLSPNAKFVACNLRRYMNSQNDMAWPSNSRIQGETGLSESSVRRALHILRDEGWISDTGHSELGTIKYQACVPSMSGGGVTVTGVSHRQPGGVTQTPKLNNELNNTLSKGKTFSRPTLEQVQDYCQEKQYVIDPETFINYYNSNGWKVGRASMKCWKSACANWNSKEKKNGPTRAKAGSAILTVKSPYA